MSSNPQGRVDTSVPTATPESSTADSRSPTPEAVPAAADSQAQQEYLRILLIAAVLGLPAALLGALLMSLVHGTTLLMWTTIPEAFKWSTGSPPGWYVVAIPTLGGLLVSQILRLPGRGGESPAAGFSMDALSPLHAVSALLAAIVTLGFGLVLGPEMPLVILGTTLGLWASGLLRPGASQGQLLVVAGAFATISTLFGGPLVSALLLLEMLAFSGRVPSKQLIPALVPGFLASGTAALAYTGIDKWPGVHLSALSVGPLPNYPQVRLADVLWSIPIAIVSAAIVAIIRAGAKEGAVRTVTMPSVAVLAGAGFVVGLLAVIFRAISGQSVNLVLFSGETSLPSVTVETSAGIVLLLVLCKGAGYFLSLTSGFRGGPTFPGAFLGGAIGVLAHIVLPGCDLTPAVIAGLAAATTGVFDTVIFGALFAAFLAGSAISAETLPIAVIAAVLGWLVTTAVKTWVSAREQAATAS